MDCQIWMHPCKAAYISNTPNAYCLTLVALKFGYSKDRQLICIVFGQDAAKIREWVILQFLSIMLDFLFFIYFVFGNWWNIKAMHEKGINLYDSYIFCISLAYCCHICILVFLNLLYHRIGRTLHPYMCNIVLSICSLELGSLMYRIGIYYFRANYSILMTRWSFMVLVLLQPSQEFLSWSCHAVRSYLSSLPSCEDK